MKDVASCDKLRGTVKQVLIRSISEWGNPAVLIHGHRIPNT